MTNGYQPSHAALLLLRADKMLQLEEEGRLDPECPTCQREFYPYYTEKWTPGGSGPFAPSHKASTRCRSGGYAHCTCDTCF